MSNYLKNIFNNYTVAESLELIAASSVLKSVDASEEEKYATILSVLIDSQFILDEFLNEASCPKMTKDEFFTKFITDKAFFNNFMNVDMRNNLDSAGQTILEFADNYDLKEDANFKNVAGVKESVLYPFKNVQQKDVNGQNKFCFYSDTVDEFNDNVIPTIAKGFRVRKLYEGTNKQGKILFRKEKNQRSGFIKDVNPLRALYAKVSNFVQSRNLEPNQDKVNIPVATVYANNIRDNRKQRNKVNSIAKGISSSLIIDDERENKFYSINSGIEKIGSLVYDNVMSISSQRVGHFRVKSAVNHFAKCYGVTPTKEQEKTVQLLSCLIATKYILQTVQIEKYTTDGSAQAMQDCLDRVIGRVASKFGYEKWVFASAHQVAKMITQEYMQNAKLNLQDYANIFTNKVADSSITSSNEAMFRTMFDINDILINNKIKYYQEHDNGADLDAEILDEEETIDVEATALDEVEENDKDDTTNLSLRERIFRKYYIIYPQKDLENIKNNLLAEGVDASKEESSLELSLEAEDKELDNKVIGDSEKNTDNGSLNKTYVQDTLEKYNGGVNVAEPSNKTPNKVNKENDQNNTKEHEGRSFQRSLDFYQDHNAIIEESVNSKDVLDSLAQIPRNHFQDMIKGLDIIKEEESERAHNSIDATVNIGVANKMYQEIEDVLAYLDEEDNQEKNNLKNDLVKNKNSYLNSISYAEEQFETIKNGPLSNEKVSKLLADSIVSSYSLNLEDKIIADGGKRYEKLSSLIKMNRGRKLNAKIHQGICEAVKELCETYTDLLSKEKSLENNQNFKQIIVSLKKLSRSHRKEIYSIAKNIKIHGAKPEYQLALVWTTIYDNIRKTLSKDRIVDIDEWKVAKHLKNEIKREFNSYVKTFLIDSYNLEAKKSLNDNNVLQAN